MCGSWVRPHEKERGSLLMGSGPLRRAARLLGAAGLVLLARCAPGAGLVVAAGLVLIVACAPASVQPAAPAQPAAPGQADASGQPAAGQPAPAAPASMAPPAVAQVTYGIAARSFSYLPSVVAE